MIVPRPSFLKAKAKSDYTGLKARARRVFPTWSGLSSFPIKELAIEFSLKFQSEGRVVILDKDLHFLVKLNKTF